MSGATQLRILYAKSKWERPGMSLAAFLSACRDGRYDASELNLMEQSESPDEIADLHARNNLALLGHVATSGTTPDAHLNSLDALVPRAAAAGALQLNCQSGRDWFSFEDNLRILRHATLLAREHGLALHHETHRARALYSAPATVRLLEAMPELTLTADFSHWFCVHESDLTDQGAALSQAVGAARHLHARVGFAQGPQVADPFSPAALPWLERHLTLWREVLDVRRAAGAAMLTVTPEFGPAPYMPVSGPRDLPAADAWEVNLAMRDYLRAHLG